MKNWLALATVITLAGSASSVIAGGVPLGVHYIGHEKVAAEMVKGGRILEENGLIIIANRGVMRGAEIHAKTNHVFIIVDGEADFVTGGKMIDPKEISPGQIRGKGIEGGTVHRLSKGRCDYHSCEDAALVERYLEDRLRWLLCGEY